MCFQSIMRSQIGGSEIAAYRTENRQFGLGFLVGLAVKVSTMRLIVLLLTGVGFCLPMFSLATEPDMTELERWLESDEMLPPSVSTEHVNEGELVFLVRQPSRPVHHHQNQLTINAASLRDGWVQLNQCHEHLDRVPAAQITYNKERIRDLQIVTSGNIEQSWVEDKSVQLRNIQENAHLCVRAWTRALRANGDGSYSLRNGPFMRRFLDGYYPMRVSMQIEFASSGLHLVAMKPQRQQGFEVTEREGYLAFDAWFEGSLKTEFLFRQNTL